MKDFNIMLVFDLAIAGLGAYLLYTAFHMRQEKKVPPILLAKEEVDRCEDPEGFTSYMFPKTLVFAVVSTICGILCFLSDLKVLPLSQKSGNIFGIVMLLIFLAVWLYFIFFLKKAKEKYFKSDIYL
ncbi:MAG: hypothetical protein DUD27_00975 [Lachnospiraceae bacterium]|uniref:DUF3784 domain-containing protein n=1 Tax=Candidatus Weimeria bifida TaxID=2599074 RepID=A0A6N7IX99_9FIRM|nr:hypothetical protein [Candidatus Weimeria bifida]RRF97164.1 MAG: hypothetical protein DUD27_00975 [Lachnospiraceae bacterium]